ncbi:helix-turn-helix domain-containing protein [Mesorhizobium sp. M7A.F.Ca.US.011.01.1.1]|uniref:helix-turn-helix domain-containing protein n=1 Tax=Mesorhizobium sp. M7A.F.Ca.US.011.01.1.1 TaxID=2496741 RepID=UPI000FC9E665|nr:helix-turn-helix transcriptional regulator [Mesorhizobium sp. M7A.F.Ca.US.011.01.1.1]RUX31587.1 helix-turn-helix domain-containing protein [Mesorhizobium sp. M7A.F.Ca.US.011.01.1.1]
MPQGKANVDKVWFDSQMKERNLTVRRMATQMNMHYSALSRTLNGERRMQVDEIRKIAEIFDQPESEVLVHLGSSDAKAAERRSGFMEGQVDFENASDINDTAGEYIVPPRGGDPLFGCMAGTLTLLPDVDYTAPADPDWGKVYDD